MAPKKLTTRPGDRGQARSRARIAAAKPASHYGERLLGADDRAAALRAAHALVTEAVRRTT